MRTFIRRSISSLLLSALLFGEVFALTITEVRTRDLDDNGQIDTLVATFDANVDIASLQNNDFDFSGGYSSSATSLTGPQEATITLNESGTNDTDTTPTVSIAPGETIVDILANVLDDSFGGIIATDTAKPVVLTLTTSVLTGNYKTGDTFPITATLSEPVLSGNITLNFNNGQSLVLNATGTNTVSGTYTVVNGDDTTDLSIGSHTNTLLDGAGQVSESTLPLFGATKTLAIDTIAPVATEGTNLGTYQTTSTPSYTFVSSEPTTITYGGNCSSTTTIATTGNNSITFNALAEGLHNNCTLTLTDNAGNTDTLNISAFTVDTIAPVIDIVSIYSNNALDTSLAKTNDTIFIDVDYTETNPLNLIATAQSASILGNTTSTVTFPAGKVSFRRFTTGVENSEVVTPFSFFIQDAAGNTSTVTTATTDTSTVRFDRTQPMIDTVGIAATSQDASAFLGDLPVYYAKQGDNIKLTIDAMDYVDVLSMTGTLFGQAVNLTNTVGSTWEVELTNVDGLEGEVPYSILVTDNAGNQVTVTGPTTANNKVVFDKTLPDDPTTVVDLDGSETTNFKHRLRASYNWSGQNDLDATDTFAGSGIVSYNVQYSHGTFGLLHDVNVLHPTTSFTPNLLTPDDDPYFFSMNTKDKAGNETVLTQRYEQRYTIGIIGTITDQNGNPLNNAVAQVVARFNNTCNIPSEVCVDFTVSDGKFFVVTQKERDYTLSVWNQYHHLAKAQVRVELDDVTVNFKLNTITSPHEIQRGNQGIIITTNVPFQVEDNSSRATEILVGALSGEITVNQINTNEFTVTSLSRINSISSNNPNAHIVKIGENTFLVQRVGSFTGTHSLANTEKDAFTISHGTDRSFGSSASRLGVEFLHGNGKGNARLAGSNRSDFIGTGAGISYEESLAYAAKLNEGTKAKTHSYINRNGFVVFSGYQNGRMALDRFKYRYQNTVQFRGGYRTPWKKYERIETTNPGGRHIVKYVQTETLAEKTAAMKALYQKDQSIRKEHIPGSAPNTKEAFVTYSKKNNHHGLGRVKNDQISAVTAKKMHDQHSVNKFERKRMFPHSAGKSRMKTKNQNIIRFKGSTGSVSMGDVFQN